jgi:hypothetical protein
MSKAAIWGKDRVKRFNDPADVDNKACFYEVCSDFTNKRQE